MKQLSLSHKLALLIASVLIVVLVAAIWTTYQIAARAQTTSAEQTLGRLVSDLARSIDGVTRRQANGLRSLGNDRTVRELLLRDSVDSRALREALLLRLSLPSTATVRIWRRDGRQGTLDVSPSSADEERSKAIPSRDDSSRFGPLYVDRDTVVYWAVSPIVDAAGLRLGWIGERRPIASSPEEERSIRSFLGGDVAVYFRNDTGSFWVDLAGRRVSSPLGAKFHQGIARYYRPALRSDLIAAESDIRNTAWTLVLERSRSAAIAGVRSSLLRLTLFGIALLIVATGAVWLISHRFVGPITTVAQAAQTMGTGEYDARVDSLLSNRKDEVGQLAQRFNHMAAEVQAVHSNLQQRVHEIQSLNEDLEQSAVEADEANRAKSRFVTRMSHELRTPLNAIAGYTELLEMGIHGPLNSEQLDALRRIRRSQQTLLSHIDDVLGVARLESGQVRYDIRTVTVLDAVNAAHTLVAPQLATKAIRFEIRGCDASPAARADGEKVQRILTNLLSNAMKFTKPHGEITMECRTVGDRVMIDVRDTGIGIASDRTEVIFEPFMQLRDDLTRTAEGMGLGLAISRELARGMGGDLTVESEEGRGSVFTLIVPSDGTASVEHPRIMPASQRSSDPSLPP